MVSKKERVVNHHQWPLPYAPCMVYWPTFGPFVWPMLVNIPAPWSLWALDGHFAIGLLNRKIPSLRNFSPDSRLDRWKLPTNSNDRFSKSEGMWGFQLLKRSVFFYWYDTYSMTYIIYPIKSICDIILSNIQYSMIYNDTYPINDIVTIWLGDTRIETTSARPAVRCDMAWLLWPFGPWDGEMSHQRNRLVWI